jgi:hypothetical protein
MALASHVVVVCLYFSEAIGSALDEWTIFGIAGRHSYSMSSMLPQA